jgi:threonine dehydrogenase-like Zn-dependent dehydrogenase
MKAIRFDAAIPRYALGLTLGRFYPPLLWSGLSCTYAADVPEPALPAPDWLRIRTRLAGICGTDTGTIQLHTSPYYTPFSSFPFTLGHETIGTIAAVGETAGSSLQVGERVTINPLLWCAPRGFREYCEYCARGEINRCLRITQGDIAAGQLTGACRDTGGSWSASFVAHASQIYRIPAEVSDENALLVEPFAVGIHAALASWPSDDETALIVGAGTIGLTTLAALRGLGSRARILVLARYPFQAAAAQRLGADEVLATISADPYAWVAEKTGGTVQQPLFGKRTLTGGSHHTFECVGSDSAIDDALRFTRGGGTMTLVGLPGVAKEVNWSALFDRKLPVLKMLLRLGSKGIDWSTIFDQELTVKASNYYNHAEIWQGQRWESFDLALHLLESGNVDLGWMVTHRYRLEDYARALRDTLRRGDNGMIKGAFVFS